MPIPSYIEDNIARINSVTKEGTSENYKALGRLILDQIIISNIYEESSKETMGPQEDQDLRTRISHLSVSMTGAPEDLAKLELSHKTPLSKAVIYKREKRLLSGLADYSLSYKGSNSKTLDTNFVIVQAKHQYCPDLGMPELAAYMGIIHTTRKEDSKHDCVVFGMVSDGIVFRFCQTDNEGIFAEGKPLDWSCKDHPEEIYSNLRSIIRKTALSCPSSTPIEDPMNWELVLSAFGSPNRSNTCGSECSEPMVFVIDEQDEWMYDIISMD